MYDTYIFLCIVTYYTVSFFTISVLHFRHSSRRFVFQHPQKGKHSLGCLLRHFLTYVDGLLKQKIHGSRQDKLLQTAD